jgi:hypothetical protein
MMLEGLLSKIDECDQGGPGTYTSEDESSYEVMEQGIEIPGAAKTFVDRYSSSNNESTTNNLAAFLSTMAETPTDETANLVYVFLERVPNWNHNSTCNNALNAISLQAINGTAWTPPEATPPVLSRFLLHCLEVEPDGLDDLPERAIHALWSIHNWASERGGLRSVLKPEERQAFRDKFDEVGLEPKPILEALGEN